METHRSTGCSNTHSNKRHMKLRLQTSETRRDAFAAPFHPTHRCLQHIGSLRQILFSFIRSLQLTPPAPPRTINTASCQHNINSQLNLLRCVQVLQGRPDAELQYRGRWTEQQRKFVCLFVCHRVKQKTEWITRAWWKEGSRRNPITRLWRGALTHGGIIHVSVTTWGVWG